MSGRVCCPESFHHPVLTQPYLLPGLLQNSLSIALSTSTPAPHPIHSSLSSQSDFLECESDCLIPLLQTLPPHLG